MGNIDNQLMETALKRVKAKREFKYHATAYVMVNIFLIVIWFLDFGFLNPLLVMLGWGIGLSFHYLELRETLKSDGDEVMAEYNKLKDSQYHVYTDKEDNIAN